jgi:hypothetical protein
LSEQIEEIIARVNKGGRVWLCYGILMEIPQ